MRFPTSDESIEYTGKNKFRPIFQKIYFKIFLLIKLLFIKVIIKAAIVFHNICFRINGVLAYEKTNFPKYLYSLSYCARSNSCSGKCCGSYRRH